MSRSMVLLGIVVILPLDAEFIEYTL
jgi:hypothetical protein